MAPTTPRFHLHALGSAGLVLATLTLVAVLVPAASCSPPADGVPTTAPVPCSTPLADDIAADASAYTSPPSVAALSASAEEKRARSEAVGSLGAATTTTTRNSTSSSTPLVDDITADASAYPSRPIVSALSASASTSPAPDTVRDDAARVWPSSTLTRSSSSAGNATLGSASTMTVDDAEEKRARSEAVGSLGAPKTTTTRNSTSSSTPLVVIATDASASPSLPIDAGVSADASASASPSRPVVSACAASPASPPPATVREAAPVWSSATPSSPRTRSAATRHPHSPTASSPPPTTVRDAPPVCSSPTPASSAPSSPRTRSASSPGIAMVGSAPTFTVDAEAIRCGRSASASPGCWTTSTVDTEEPRDRSEESVESTVTQTIPSSTSSSSSPGRMLLILSMVAAILAAAGGWAAKGGEQQRHATDDYCELCFVKKAVFVLECCEMPVCNLCLHDFLREGHEGSCKRLAPRKIVPLLPPHQLEIGGDLPADYVHQPQYPPWYFVKSVKKNSRLHLFYNHLQELEMGADPRVTEVIHLVDPGDKLSAAIVCDIRPRMRTFSEL